MSNKWQCIIEIDLDEGDYEMKFHRKEGSGVLEYDRVKKVFKSIVSKWCDEVENSGIDSDDNLLKEIH